MDLVLLSEVWVELEEFWGSAAEDAPSMSNRKEKMAQALMSAIKYGIMEAATDKPILRFKIGTVQDSTKRGAVEKPRILVCEEAYISIVGCPNAGAWKAMKNKLMNYTWSADGKDQAEELAALLRQTKDSKEKHVSQKAITSRLFIEYLAEFCSDTSPLGQYEEIRIVPFEKISQLFHEYTVTMRYDNEKDCNSNLPLLRPPLFPMIYLLP